MPVCDPNIAQIYDLLIIFGSTYRHLPLSLTDVERFGEVAFGSSVVPPAAAAPGRRPETRRNGSVVGKVS